MNNYDRIKSMSVEEMTALINRQKAEIERLQGVKTCVHNLISHHDFVSSEAYNEYFERTLKKLYDNTKIKTEAIKEFAERLKDTFKGIFSEPCNTQFDWILHDYVPRQIDNLVKEMTEEKK